MPKGEKPKTCFVIAPIDDEGTETRERSDQVLDYVIKPVVEKCGYGSIIRADRISRPGMITSDIVQRLLDDDLVVADLTGPNANVFYELAVRHAIRRPVVQIIQAGQGLPFDVSQSRTIEVDYRNLRSVEECKERLETQIKEAEDDPACADNPISQAIDLRSWRQSDNPVAKSNAEILTLLRELLGRMAELKDMVRPVPYTQTFEVPFTAPVPPLGLTGPALVDAFKRALAERRGATGPTGPLGPTGPFHWGEPTGPTGAVGPTGPLEPPPASYRDAQNPLFDKLAQEAPPSGAEAEPQKRRRRPGKGSHKA